MFSLVSLFNKKTEASLETGTATDTGCLDLCSLTLNLREEHRLRVSESCILTRIFGPEGESNRRMEKISNATLHKVLG
jgi:hypothetical protein